MLDKLKKVEERFEDINEKLCRSDVVADLEQYKKLMQELKTLTPIVEEYRRCKAAESDVHLEADIHALAGNVNGYPEGAWMPFLHITYELVKVGGGEPIRGHMMPMVASDGPHYGDNVKLQGPGKYKVKFTIHPPSSKDNPVGQHFGRHTDRATGVRPWFKTFEVEWEFTFAGIGKKGGY